jgi:hypothetical protein
MPTRGLPRRPQLIAGQPDEWLPHWQASRRDGAYFAHSIRFLERIDPRIIRLMPHGVPVVAHKIDKISGQIKLPRLPDHGVSIWALCHGIRHTRMVPPPALPRPTLATS